MKVARCRGGQTKEVKERPEERGGGVRMERLSDNPETVVSSSASIRVCVCVCLTERGLCVA